MTDQEFREQHKPLHVPASYDRAQDATEQVVFALADIGEGTADEVTRHLQQLDPQAEAKPLIAGTHQILSELYDRGLIAAEERDGTLVYNLHKITERNKGAVDPHLLAPGLD